MKWLYLFLVLVLVPLSSAIPDYPHEFYGSVSNDNGLVSSGTITARLCNNEFSTQIIDGHYGKYISKRFLVWKDDCYDTNIEFFVDGNKIDDYTYVPYGETRLDLNVPVVDTSNDNPPVDNPLSTQDTQTDGEESEGKPRDTSHIQPPPKDLVFDNKEEQDLVQGTNEIQSEDTNKIVYEFLTETKVGVVTLFVSGLVGFLGLLYLLKVLFL